MLISILSLVTLLLQCAQSLRYDPAHKGYNLNENETAVHPRDYWGEWENHTHFASPDNWRFPFYVLTLDRFIDGDPTNNEANGTVFEHDWMSNQFRFGGDARGVHDNLDYLQGMGVKAIYFTGSMMINMPWSPDGYGPLDLTLLDRHHGDIEEWRSLIAEIHDRGMYVVFDNTMSTLGDLLGYAQPYTNGSVEFNFGEYDYIYKDPERVYHDFQPSNDWDDTCKLPHFWEQDGYQEPMSIMDQFDGCRAGEFDMYGDIKGTGAYPSYINQLSRFASVQDRLKEWQPEVLEKINTFSCMQIAMLDIDGFRMDKATQTTLDAMADFSTYQRQCAKKFGKDNFLMVGEVVADPKLGADYYGRGKKPDQALTDESEAVFTSDKSNPDNYIRPWGQTALDGAAFHYDFYGSLTRFLGLDGPWGSQGVDWVEMWHTFLRTHDLVNANTGLFDPRHMFGTTNQDVFRWPALADGTHRQLLGMFVSFLEMPGIPMILYGEEQQSYILENAAPDYVYGRQPMASSRAWQLHGCYNLGEEVYVDMPFNSSAYGCHDDSVSLDHRDPSHFQHNIIKRMFELRQQYPVLNDGFELETLSTRIQNSYLRGSQGMPSPHGVWSVYRGRNDAVQDFNGTAQGNQPVWLVFSNENRTASYDFDCSSNNNTSQDGALVSAFAANTTVKNLFYPYEEYTLDRSTFKMGLENSTEQNGCLPRLSFAPWEFKAFVPVDSWEQPRPVITRVLPGHDGRIVADAAYNETQSVGIQIRFSSEMDCDSVANSLRIESTTELGETARLNKSSIVCKNVTTDIPHYVGQVPTAWTFTADLENVAHGIHTYTVNNATAADGIRFTNARDRFQFRIGHMDNPMIFTNSANYTTGLLQQEADGALTVTPKAAGADLVRYSTNWGGSYSSWQPYTGEKIVLRKQAWSGTKDQEWDGEHVILNYWSKMAGSSDHVQHSDLGRENKPARRWPHAWVEGIWNQWGFDAGIKNRMEQDTSGNWTFDLFTEWPTNISVNVWGMNPDGQPDKSMAYGDLDRDGVLDWVWPNSIAPNVINISAAPQGKLGYRLVVNDGNYNYSLIPYGSQAVQIVVMVLLCLIPISTAIAGVYAFQYAFYKVKFNKVGAQTKQDLLTMITPTFIAKRLPKLTSEKNILPTSASSSPSLRGQSPVESPRDMALSSGEDAMSGALAADAGAPNRRSVLIATMEYEIEDYGVKIKIGGLGVMASLMGKNLQHQNLIWVVPCAGGIDYPFEEGSEAESMNVTILGQEHKVAIHYHVVRNITYVLLDAPIFRKRTKQDPYPPRMDDLESGIYYSAWNQCIAETCRRFKPDLYHINDYHGACAPLYLLPDVIPCCLSLHNAEFQGMWPLKNAEQMRETSRIFNLSEDVIKKYVQFGEVFNLLHAGSSYLRIHQQGFGAVGVSNKYGKRSLARYPIFWGLEKIGALPNPDPSDTAPWDRNSKAPVAKIDVENEKARAGFRRQAQEWAGLNVDEKAELFIFVGRWSMQKGVDLIADVFPSILEKHENTQLICVGPVIDLYGKFAALKLDKLMAKYPGRVFSKPEFTALPPYLFSGAEFALMPSRDEPFGLVAVEFGRKGALCVGARVGGFGHMPGWWFTVESVTPKHLVSQFKSAISAALESDTETRALMRAYSVLQRFPVAQWVEDLEKLQSRSIYKCDKVKSRPDVLQKLRRASSQFSLSSASSDNTVVESGATTPSGAMTPISRSAVNSPYGSRAPSRTRFGFRSRAGSRDNTSAPDMPRQPPRLLISRYPGARTTEPDETDDEHPSDETQDREPEAPDAEEIQRALDINALRLSLTRVQQSQPESNINQNVTPFFNDTRNTYYDKFSQKLEDLNSKTSEGALCIEEYIMDSEKDWFNNYHSATLRGKGSDHSSKSLMHSLRGSRIGSRIGSRANSRAPSRSPSLDGNTMVDPNVKEMNIKDDSMSEYDEILGENYEAPHGLRNILSIKFGNWYIYCFLLAFGQIISANSYQLTLLTGQVGEPAEKLYILSAIYLVASAVWWIMYRTIKAVWCLSLPWLFFGAAFFCLGMGIVTNNDFAKGWIFNVAAGLYAIGSSAGSLFFSLNFGTEGGTPSQTWAFRACVIGGSQQILVAFLWYWGSYLTRSGGGSNSYTPSGTTLTAVTIPLAVLMWFIGIVLFLGLPEYYRAKPGAVPSFYRAICRRGVVVWFWIMVILQGYWLSAPYNRNWMFLWASDNAPRWATALLILGFFVFVWAGMLGVLGYMSKQHSWIIPIFAIALGAPRWCQMLWGISGIGAHIPWAGLVGGALVSRCVWLWLGVLDALQGVGFGMILLMTLTRMHITFTLLMAQVIGSAITILARATSPDSIGAGTVFPNMASESLAKVWFWIGLACQLIICVGYFKFFRKAQLMKP